MYMSLTRKDIIHELPIEVTKANERLGWREQFIEIGHTHIEMYYKKWLDFILNELNFINTQEKSENVANYRAILISGLLGLARVYHTSLNNYLHRHKDDTAKSLDEIKAIQTQVYDRYLSEAPDQSVHNNPIDWQGEIDQDLANTYIRINDLGNAEHILNDGIKAAKERADAALKSGSEKHLAAIRSALGVLLRRRSELNGSQRDLNQGLRYTLESNKVLPNQGRKIAIAGFAAKSAFTDYRDREHMRDRVENAVIGTSIIISEHISRRLKSDRTNN